MVIKKELQDRMTNRPKVCYDAKLTDASVKVQRMEHTFQFFSDDEGQETEDEVIIGSDGERTFQFFSDDEDSESESDGSEGSESGGERTLKVRLDKWLWAARFFKTRAVARAAVEKGKVFYNGQRSKPSREIELGAILQIRQGRFEKTVIVKGLSTRRRSTDEALQLFEETEESRLAREQMGEWSPPNQYAPAEYSNQSNYFQQSEQPRERRVVRFLRRSFVRGEQQPRQDKPSSYSNNFKQPEFEAFDD